MSSSSGQLTERYDVACRSQRTEVKSERFSDATKEQTRTAVEQLLALLEEHDAVGLSHLAVGVHGDAVVDEFRTLFGGVIELTEDGSVYTPMAE